LESTHVGGRLRAIRRRADVTQRTLSATTGISQQRISMIESGAERLWPGYRARLAQALGVSETDLI
jgi:transcriptional regulator with XRE-family HTH domain